MPRRIQAILLLSALVAAPAAGVLAVCAGPSCERPARAEARVPFCSLPDELRTLISGGFREGRSPEVLAVAADAGIRGGTGFQGPLQPAWPSLASATRAEVPVAFVGPGIEPRTLPDGFGLDDVAPTLADIIGLRRPHPEVRSGQEVRGLWSQAPPRLAVEVVLKGVGTPDITQPGWGFLAQLARRGAATPNAATGSLPLDPAAIVTTIGTGGLPRQHGITGTLVRNDSGRLVRAWGAGAPVSVIATLADDLDHRTRHKAMVGLVATSASDRGIIGKNWYLDADRATVLVAPRDAAAAATEILRTGYGDDGVADLLAVVAQDRPPSLGRLLRRLEAAAGRASGGSFVLVVTATGSALGRFGGRRAAEVVDHVERTMPGVVEAAAAGGLFLDQGVAARRSISEDAVVRALAAMRSRGRPALDDSFGSNAVSFGRYC
jgi:hypothetical protein